MHLLHSQLKPNTFIVSEEKLFVGEKWRNNENFFPTKFSLIRYISPLLKFWINSPPPPPPPNPQKKRPPASFSAVTPTNEGIWPQNFLTYRFNFFTINFKAIGQPLKTQNVERNRNYALKCNPYLYFLIWQKLWISDKKCWCQQNSRGTSCDLYILWIFFR